MVVMQQAMRRMVKTAQKFARRTAAAVKMQVSFRHLPVLPSLLILDIHIVTCISLMEHWQILELLLLLSTLQRQAS